MASYSYEVLDRKGKQKKGSIIADDQEKALIQLKSEGYMPISVTEQSVLNRDIELPFLKNRVKLRDLSVFCRQLVSIIGAGVTVLEALEMLAKQTESKVLSEAIQGVIVGIEKGSTLASAMAEYSDVFPMMLINMVEAGEASGSLETAFDRMAIQFEKEAKLSGLIKKAMIYPCLLCVVAVGVIIVMLTYVIPTFEDMFTEIGTGLPAITVAVLNASDFLTKRWYIILLVVMLIVIGITFFRKMDAGKRVFGMLAIKIPLFGKLTVKTASSRLARTLSTLLAAGVSMVDALEITAKNMSNVYFQKALMQAKDDVMKGIPLSDSLLSAGIFPPMVNHMVKIGEETGNIESMLEKMADYYDEEVEIATQSLMAALEPAIIVVMALIVGVLIWAVVAPMGKLYTDLDSL